MIDYKVLVDYKHNKFTVYGPFSENAIPIEIPKENPQRKAFIDLFLHKADIDRGIDFLQCISENTDITHREALFIAGLNNCMKCFKYSKARNKLDKNVVFANSAQMLSLFVEFEKMRDKHYDHDENGMLQATAFLLVCDSGEKVFGGPPSVVWNRTKFDYLVLGKMLENVMLVVQEYICNMIDSVGRSILLTYMNTPKADLMKWKATSIELASSDSKR